RQNRSSHARARRVDLEKERQHRARPRDRGHRLGRSGCRQALGGRPRSSHSGADQSPRHLEERQSVAVLPPQLGPGLPPPSFHPANLGVPCARALPNRRIHEEALEVLKAVRPEQVVDPAAYLFHRAVAEHALLNKGEATKTIVRLLEDAATSPERYKTVSALM